MNEKIKSVALECYHPYGNFDLEKFANLLLKDCIDIAEQTRYEGKVVAERIKFVYGIDQTNK